MKKIINLLLVFYSLFSLNVVALEYNPNTPLQFDPEIATGQLDNGLIYYVYENEEAKNAIERINKKKLLEAERKANEDSKNNSTD